MVKLPLIFICIFLYFFVFLLNLSIFLFNEILLNLRKPFKIKEKLVCRNQLSSSVYPVTGINPTTTLKLSIV